MRTIIIVLFSMLLTQTSFAQSEINLFDKEGNPVAYIDTNDEWTIYLWEGKPVAYIIKDEQTLHIYGFNGKHLGWYINGILRDHDGNAVGFKKGAVTSIYEKYEGYKGYKEYKPYKIYREYAPYQPYLSAKFSYINLNGFLHQGIDSETTHRNRQIYDAPDPIMETDLDLLEKVILTKQALFDQRAKNVQEVINQISYYLTEVLKYNTTEFTEQDATLKSNIRKINITHVDYSDLNQYNQIIVPLKNHLSIVKGRFIILQRHEIIQNKITSIFHSIENLKKVDTIFSKQVTEKLENFIGAELGDEAILSNDFRYNQLFPYFDNFLKEVDNLTKQVVYKKQKQTSIKTTNRYK